MKRKPEARTELQRAVIERLSETDRAYLSGRLDAINEESVISETVLRDEIFALVVRAANFKEPSA